MSDQRMEDVLEDLLLRRGRSVTALNVSIFLWGLKDRSVAERYLRSRSERVPGDPYSLVFLAQILCWQDRRTEAEELVRRIMSSEAHMGLQALQQGLVRAMEGGSAITSEYLVFPNSTMQNIGFYSHAVVVGGEVVRWLTKLTTKEFIGTELFFAERIASAHPAFNEFVPPLTDIRHGSSSDLCYVTMPLIEGEVLRVEGMQDREVDAFVRTYCGIEVVAPFTSVPELLGNPFEIGLSHAYLVSAFQRIHTADGSTRIARELEEYITTRGYPEEVQRAVLNVVAALREARLYDRIEPEKHYTLLHGDMHRNNVLTVEGRFWIIDWGKCAIGPRGIDLAVLFRRFPFTRMRAILERNEVFAVEDDIGRILFAYALIVVSVLIDIDPIKKEPPDQLFLPAADFITEGLARLR